MKAGVEKADDVPPALKMKPSIEDTKEEDAKDATVTATPAATDATAAPATPTAEPAAADATTTASK